MTDTSASAWSDAALRLLAQAGRVLHASLDLSDVLADLGTLLVPAVVDAVIVQLADPITREVTGEFAQALPDQQELLGRYLSRFAPALRPGSVLRQTIETGQPTLVAEVTESDRRAWVAAPEQLRELAAFPVSAVYTVPLIARGRVLGGIGFMMTTSGRRFGSPERLLADELASRAALAIDTVQLLELHESTEDAFRRSEQLARERLDELETVYATAPVGLCVLDADLRYRRINRRLAEINGFSPEAHLGRTVQEMIPSVADLLVPEFRRVLETGEPILNREFSGEVPSAPGEIRTWVEQVYPMRDRSGAIIGLSVVAEDITDRKRAEEALTASRRELETVLAQMPSGVVIVRAPDGHVLVANERVGEIWRQPVATDASGALTGAFEATFPDGRKVDDRMWPLARALFDGETVNGEELRIVRGDGTAAWLLVSAAPVRIGGETVAAVVTFEDITHIREAARRLREANRLEAVGRLAGGLAHDFNNQLQTVAGFAELVRRDPGLTDRSRSDLSEIIHTAGQMAELTRQLLAFSRKQVLAPETLDLNAVIAEAEPILGRLIGSAAELVIEARPEPCWVRVDRAQLFQVLITLATNARDAMKRGGRLTLATSVRRLDEPLVRGAVRLDPGSYVHLSVADSGRGLGPEQLRYIFEPFFGTGEEGREGGLGLAAVQGVVLQSGGQIWAESSPGRAPASPSHCRKRRPPRSRPAPPRTPRPRRRWPAGVSSSSKTKTWSGRSSLARSSSMDTRSSRHRTGEKRCPASPSSRAPSTCW